MKRRLLAATLALACCLVTSAAFAQTVTRGPYVQSSTTDGTIIVWRTDSSSSGTVRYGSTANNLNQTATSGQDGTQHEVLLTGLSPGTRYYYAVGTDQAVLAGGDANHYFDTAPPVGTAGPIRMWVVGDSGTGGRRQGEVRDAMLADVGANVPQLFLHVGDMAYSDGLDSEFQDKFFAMYQDVLRNTVCWPALGNHEGHTSDSDTQSGPYYDAYALPTDGRAGGIASGTEAYYAFDWGNVHFIVLDSHDSPREATGPMAAWLQQDLGSTSADWIIAFWHHPPYTKGSHDSDDEGQLIDMREEILPILEAGGVDLVLTGHSHIYERSYLLNGAYNTPSTTFGILDSADGRPNGDGPYLKPAGASEGAVYIVAGHGGTGVSGEGDHPLMYFSEVQNGSCIIDVDGNLLTVRNVRWDGVVSDEVAMTKGDGVFLIRPASDEVIEAGSTYAIQWAAPSARAVKVEFSADDGANWTVLAAEVAGANSYDWAVPAAPTNLGRIRITDADDPTVTAMNARPFVITDQVPQVVIPWGGVWKYDDDGGDYPDDSWTGLAFDDSGWKSGTAELGYGDGDETTELLDADPNVPSVLFRYRLNLERAVSSGTIDAIYDDAIAIWVNGELVHDENMPTIIETTLYAIDSSGDNAVTQAQIGPQNPFVAGDNVIAVMVKQANESSSDLSFNLQLTLTLEADFPDPPDMGVGMPDAGTTPGQSNNGVGPGPTSDASNPQVSSDMGTGSGGGNGGGNGSGSGSEGCNCASVEAGPASFLLLLGLVGFRRRRSARRRN